MRQNAPHLVSDLGFVVPNYDWWEAPFYGIGLKIYNLLSGKYGFGPSQILSRDETLKRLPTIKTEGLRGGVIYYDGQFDDARLLIDLAETASRQGATLLNYAPVTGFVRGADGFLSGVTARDAETGREFTAMARVIVNATGAFTDNVRKMADAHIQPMIAPSQGIHLVFDGSFLAGDSAIMVPHTSDGRVMFAIPWHGHTVVGTTDTPIAEATLDPLPFEEEVDFILTTAARYLSKAPTRADVLSVFVGIRPLVKAGDAKSTAALSRDHTIHIDETGLLTITGGKWTTYRHMAEDCVNQASLLARLEEKPCVTRDLNIHGFHENAKKDGSLAVYGSEAVAIQDLARAAPELSAQLHPDLPVIAAQVVWAARQEMARTVEDVLARRTRSLFLNASAAIEMAPAVADLLAREFQWDDETRQKQLKGFLQIAKGYLLPTSASLPPQPA